MALASEQVSSPLHLQLVVGIWERSHSLATYQVLNGESLPNTSGISSFVELSESSVTGPGWGEREERMKIYSFTVFIHAPLCEWVVVRDGPSLV